VVASVPKSHLDMAQNNSYNAAQAARDRSALKAQIAKDRAALRNGQTSRRPAPRPKAAPQRGNAQRRAGPQRKTRLSFDSFNPSIMPLAFSVGRCTRLQGLSRGDFSSTESNPTNTYKLAIFNGSPGHYVGRLISVNTAASPPTATTVKLWSMGSAGFDQSTGAFPSATGTYPDHAMCAKFSVRIRNMAKAVDVGGVVRVLNMSAGAVTSSADVPDLVNLISYVEGHPRTVTFGAAELRSTQQFDTHPVDQAQYHSFVTPNLGITQWEAALENPAMSTIVMVFPTFPENQYEITANGHYYARYRVSGPLANMASNPPIAELSALNRARDEAEALGSRGYKAASRTLRHAEPYVGASIGRAVGGMIEGAALA
jgi:hypothetical protein